MGKVCEKCNRENRDGAIYCESCEEMLSVLKKPEKKVEEISEEAVKEAEKASGAKPVIDGKKKKNGCLTFGCIGLSVVFLLLIGAPLGTYFYFQDKVEEYLVTEPIKITPKEYADKDIDKVQAKIEDLLAGDSKILTLSASELNTLAASIPALENNIYFKITRDVMNIKGNILVSLIEEKYLSGNINVKAKTSGESISVNITKVSLENGELPQEVLENITKANALEFIQNYSDVMSLALPGLDEIISNIKVINIKKGKIQIIIN